jgi:hypothetical protein
MCKQLLLLYPARFLRMYETVISGERLLTRDQNPENNNLNSRKAAAVSLLDTSAGEGDIHIRIINLKNTTVKSKTALVPWLEGTLYLHTLGDQPP